jgi:hypothetical protein
VSETIGEILLALFLAGRLDLEGQIPLRSLNFFLTLSQYI